MSSVSVSRLGTEIPTDHCPEVPRVVELLLGAVRVGAAEALTALFGSRRRVLELRKSHFSHGFEGKTS